MPTYFLAILIFAAALLVLRRCKAELAVPIVLFAVAATGAWGFA